MKKGLFILCLLVAISFAEKNDALFDFIRGSVTPANYTHFGLTSHADVEKLEVGARIELIDVLNDSLKSSSVGNIGAASNACYVVMLLDGKATFMVLVDNEKGPVVVGFRQLANELRKMETKFDVDMEEVTLYSATQINSFLFSLPSKSRGENLTVLQPEWDTKRVVLTSFSETVNMLRSRIGE